MWIINEKYSDLISVFGLLKANITDAKSLWECATIIQICLYWFIS